MPEVKTRSSSAQAAGEGRHCPADAAVDAAVIGAGPAGLIAAEVLSDAGGSVHVFDRMPSAGRKFLMAGKGGLNITHSEPAALFITRYGERRQEIGRALAGFDAQALRAWAAALGVRTFVGSSGRVFPAEMKAAPLLRAWLHRLRSRGVHFHMRHRWLGWDARGSLRFETPHGHRAVAARSAVLALGGGSWAQLGSDGAWTGVLAGTGADIAPLRPANCGFDVGWGAHLRTRFAGQAVKNVRVRVGAGAAVTGEFIVTDYGIEGGVVYAVSAQLREEIARSGRAQLGVDLAPALDLATLTARLSAPRAKQSLANVLRARAGIAGVKAALLRECVSPHALSDARTLAAAIKSLPIVVNAPRPLDEAISSAGGVRFECLDEGLMLRARPGVFCAGEMLDWEAPTGGYLLTACFATGRLAGAAALRWLARNPRAQDS